MHFVARGLNEIKRWILFYGKGAIAIAPPELVKLVRDKIVEMNKHYIEEFEHNGTGANRPAF